MKSFSLALIADLYNMSFFALHEMCVNLEVYSVQKLFHGLPVSDFQKIAGLIHEFLLKLNEGVECSELRDAFNYTLLQLQRHCRILCARSQQCADRTALSLDGAFSPTTPRSDAADKFTWKWVELDSDIRVPGTLPLPSARDSVRLPVIVRATRQGDNGFIAQLLEHGRSVVKIYVIPH